ncbi:hypothetical protein BCR44DRAFT_322923 [Catenaria anguillulae PL171]|uniref:Uncharacterized protein n=1 Tax=Catenaria anguillulae PL171 TaxID=765915 RepID=A0A1Y2H589_9FUNG|nr:hypothetical protein BCR44DRAFT_322923 [Catenaria anguillulae PL171]
MTQEVGLDVVAERWSSRSLGSTSTLLPKLRCEWASRQREILASNSRPWCGRFLMHIHQNVTHSSKKKMDTSNSTALPIRALKDGIQIARVLAHHHVILDLLPPYNASLALGSGRDDAFMVVCRQQKILHLVGGVDEFAEVLLLVILGRAPVFVEKVTKSDHEVFDDVFGGRVEKVAEGQVLYF